MRNSSRRRATAPATAAASASSKAGAGSIAPAATAVPGGANAVSQPRAQVSARKAATDAGFLDPCNFRIQLDRNARARLLRSVRALETATRAKGKQNGTVGRPGVAILQALIFAAPVGAPIFVSWQWIQKRVGRQTIADALAALERVGVLKRHQRLTRDKHGRCRQCTNLYTFEEMDRRVYRRCDRAHFRGVLLLDRSLLDGREGGRVSR